VWYTVVLLDSDAVRLAGCLREKKNIGRVGRRPLGGVISSKYLKREYVTFPTLLLFFVRDVFRQLSETNKTVLPTSQVNIKICLVCNEISHVPFARYFQVNQQSDAV
jgi:hypothetical protein